MTMNPLRAIYEQIIQPLIGDFFVVDAALHPQKYSSSSQTDNKNDKNGCGCYMSSSPYSDDDNDVDIERGASFRSEGKFKNITLY